eukprot:gene2306-2845_t
MIGERHPTINPDGSRKMIATQHEMDINNVPLNFRDYCAHLLIVLNKCRSREYYLPWKCSEERHAYEKCQYDEYLFRMHLKNQKDHEALKLKEEKELNERLEKDYNDLKLS